MAQSNTIVKDEMSFGNTGSLVKKDEDMVDEQLKQEQMQKNPFVEKFTQLWFACYYEKRLTKQKVEATDLNAIIGDLKRYFASEDVDFRRAIPLLQGLHVLFTRKIRYLLDDSKSVLKSMTDPTEVIKVEGEEGAGHAERSKRRTGRERGHQGATGRLPVDPKNFDWFLAGIDQGRLDGILKSGADPGEYEALKLEEPYAVVRDGGTQRDDLNDVSMAFGGLNHLGNDESGLGAGLGGASAFRELPGDEMDDALLREDLPH